MTKYYFEKKEYDGEVHVFATAEGWTSEYTPDGDVDTSLEMTVGEEISQEEAEEILAEYGWEICKKCGKIFLGGSDCDSCQYEEYKKEEESKMLKEILRELNESDLLNQVGRILAEQPELFPETFYEMGRMFENQEEEQIATHLATSSLVGADDEKAIQEWINDEEQGTMYQIIDGE